MQKHLLHNKYVFPLFALGCLVVWLILNYADFRNVQSAPTVSYEEESQPARSVEFIPPKIPVEVETISKRRLKKSININGTVKTVLKTRIMSQVSGTVAEVRVREGGFVAKDSLILKVDDEPFRIAYKRKKISLERALSMYAVRIYSGGRLFLGNLGNEPQTSLDSTDLLDKAVMELLANRSRKEIIASTTGVTDAQLDLRSAELALEHTEIRAPFDGFVIGLGVLEDGIVNQGVELMELVSLDSLSVEANILEMELYLIEEGTEAKIELAALPREQFIGVVKTISPVLDRETGTCMIQIGIANPDHRIKPGMFAYIAINTEVFENRLLIPRDALLIRDNRKVAFVHEQGRAKWRYIQTGLETNEAIEVIDGLEEGDELIVSGNFSLAHDAEVIVIEK